MYRYYIYIVTLLTGRLAKMPSYCLWMIFAVFIASLGVAIDIFSKYRNRDQMENAKNDLGKEGMDLFNKFDQDGDMKISLNEFFPLSQIILSIQRMNHEVDDEAEQIDETYDPLVDEVVRLEAEMEPLILSTMSQTKKFPAFGSPRFAYSDEFAGLLAWKKVNMGKQEFYAKEFKAILPPNKYELGKTYWIIPKPHSMIELTSNRYRLPAPKNKIQRFVHKLLLMLHPRPFVIMRFAPQGGVGVVRAQNKVYLDILLRIHCEFQLNEYPHLPFWFTPAQFVGNLVIARDGSHVRDFSLQVPNEIKLNVDMEWQTDVGDDTGSNMEVDIGYIPLMRIKQLLPSSPVVLSNEDGTTFDRRELWKTGHDIELEFDKIVWEEEISTEKAKKEIDVTFYPFKKVDYLPFGEAFSRATVERKVLHQVVLWGALDDQSC